MPAPPVPSHSETLAFLLSQVGARSAQLFAEQLEPIGVTPRAYGVLSALAGADGQSQQQLADALGMHRNNMVGLIDDLEAKRWVRRRRSPTDRRAFALRLTPEGRAVVARVGEQLPALEAMLVAELRPDERDTLAVLLARIARALGLEPGVHPDLSDDGRDTRAAAARAREGQTD